MTREEKRSHCFLPGIPDVSLFPSIYVTVSLLCFRTGLLYVCIFVLCCRKNASENLILQSAQQSQLSLTPLWLHDLLFAKHLLCAMECARNSDAMPGDSGLVSSASNEGP